MRRTRTTRLRVAYLDHAARLSGAEIGLLRLIAALPDVEATVLLAEDGPLADPLREAGAMVEILPMSEAARGLKRRELRAGVAPARAAAHAGGYAWRLAARLRELGPDLVHANSLKSGLYGSLAARLARRPVIWHLHDRLAPDYLPARAVRPMRALAATAPSGLVAPSRAALATVGTRMRPGLSTAVIPLPIPPPLRTAEIRTEVRTVGIVGRLTPWKGQHVFLEGFARAFPGGGVRARIVGEAMFGESGYAAELRALAARLGVAERVEFAGFRADVEAELLELDVLVHASVIPEPLGQVVFEGMAAGLPVLAAGAGGLLEHVADGRNALLYEPGDPVALAAGLRRLEASRDLRAGLGAAGCETARRFSPEVVGREMLAFYDEVLA